MVGSIPLRLSLLIQCSNILNLQVVDFSCSQMRGVDFAEMLRESVEAKINKCRRQMRLESTISIEEDRLQAQIMALQWVQGRIQDIIINNEDKDTKIRI